MGIFTPIGVFNDYVSAESSVISSTTSTTYQQKLRLSIDDIAAGDYRVGWFFEWAYSNGSFQFKDRVQLNDETTLTERETRPPMASVDKFVSSNGFAVVALSEGSHFIDLDFCSSQKGKAAHIRRARIELWRVF